MSPDQSIRPERIPNHSRARDSRQMVKPGSLVTESLPEPSRPCSHSDNGTRSYIVCNILFEVVRLPVQSDCFLALNKRS